MQWLPHVTVATVIERDDTYLLVEEHSNGGLVFNQPAGHLDENESLQQAAVRETYEESGWIVEPKGLLGISLYHSPHNGVTYHRTTFFAEPIRHDDSVVLDDGIERIIWMTYEQMLAASERMRSSLVIRAVEQYRNGQRFPLDFIF